MISAQFRDLRSTITTAVATATLAAFTLGGPALAEDDSHLNIERELQGDYFTQLAASDSKCYVDRIRDAWEAAGKPKVKGWYGDDISDDEVEAAYQCTIGKIAGIYGKIDRLDIGNYQDWKRYNTVAYGSGTHGGRMVNNYGNDIGKAYGKYEDSGIMPVGTVLAKDSFGINKKGEIRIGPLFTMVKMEAGFNADSVDWEYALYTPKGKLMAATNGVKSKKVQFCIGCHVLAEDFDQMYFIPDEYRVQ